MGRRDKLFLHRRISNNVCKFSIPKKMESNFFSVSMSWAQWLPSKGDSMGRREAWLYSGDTWPAWPQPGDAGQHQGRVMLMTGTPRWWMRRPLTCVLLSTPSAPVSPWEKHQINSHRGKFYKISDPSPPQSCQGHQQQGKSVMDLPGGPVVKTSPTNVGGEGSIPGELRSHMPPG